MSQLAVGQGEWLSHLWSDWVGWVVGRWGWEWLSQWVAEWMGHLWSGWVGCWRWEWLSQWVGEWMGHLWSG